MQMLRIDNYIITEPIINILHRIKGSLSNGKLKDICVSSTDIKVTCPNDEHADGKEAHPDCHINIDTNNTDVPFGYFHCFACNDSGPFCLFVARCFSTSYDRAKEWLISNYGQKSSDTIIFADDIELPHKTAPRILDEKILDTFQTWTPYLAKRKLSVEMCNNFKVRYDPYHRQVIFPIYDMHGNLKMLARRNIDTKVFYMDRDQEKEVYGLNIIQKNNIKRCLISEGPIDMLSGWTNGIPTIATLGAISDYQIEQINKSCINVLYLAFDNDSAGRKFSSMLKQRLTPRIITVDVDFPESKKDLNDLEFEDWEKIKKFFFQNVKNSNENIV